MSQNSPDFVSPFTIEENGDIKKILVIFSGYSAIKPDGILTSISDGASKNWARKASFNQLNMALEICKSNGQIGELTLARINDAQNKIAALADKELIEKGDIELALDLLHFFGVDVSGQREELKTWDDPEKNNLQE